MLSDLGYIQTLASRCKEAVRTLGKAKQVFDGAGLGLESGIASQRLGIAEGRSGNPKRAARAWQEALKCFERAGARRHVGMSLIALATAHYKQMDFERAGSLYGKALAIFEETRSLAEKARCCHNYALMMIDVGDLARARSLARDALDLHTLLGQGSSLRATRLLLAAIELEAGSAGEVSRHLAAEEEGGQPRRLRGLDSGALPGLGRGDAGQARACCGARGGGTTGWQPPPGTRTVSARPCSGNPVLLRFDDAGPALELATQALTALGLAGSTLLASVAERLVGEVLSALGRTDEALERLEAVRSGLEPIPLSLHMARALRALGEAYSRVGGTGEDGLFRAAADICKRREARYDYALTLLAAGRAASRRGRFIRARRYLAEAGRVFQTLGVEDLGRQVTNEMDRALPDDGEVAAVASLSRISQALNSSHDLATVLDLTMDLAMEYLGAERGVLMLEAGPSGEPATVVHRKMDKESVEEVIGISKSIVDSVRATREPVIASDAQVDPRFRDSKSVRVHNVMSVMCVPLMRDGSLLGLIYLDNRDVPSDFSRLERAFVEAFANQVALAIENARSVGRLYDDVADLKARAGDRYHFANIIGPSNAMQEVFRQVEKVAKRLDQRHAHRGKRHRQGADRRPASSPERAQGQADDHGELRGDPQGPSRNRAVRHRQGRGDGDSGEIGVLRARRRGDAVPRRDRRYAAHHADQGAQGACREGAGAGRRVEGDQGGRPGDKCHQPGPEGPDSPRALSEGPVLQAQRDAHPPAGAQGPDGGLASAGGPLHPQVRRREFQEADGDVRPRLRCAAQTRLARQRA